MQKQNCFELGYITKLHGLKGDVILHLDVDSPFFYEKIDVVFLELSGSLVPYFIKKINVTSQKAIVSFEDINTVELANELKGLVAWLPLTALPILNEEQFYFHDVIGFEVIDSQEGNIGIVRFFNTGAAQDLMIVDYKDREIIIPVVDGIVTKADLIQKKVFVSLPEGLLDVYLED